MKIIQNVAEERETKACPTANNSDDISKAARETSGFESGEEENQEIPQQSKNKAHCFCPILAKEHGEETAVILQGIGYKVAKSKKVHKGRKWHYDTVKALKTRWPYLSRSGIHAILQRQAGKGNVLKDNFNKMDWMDRTVWYSMTDELVKRAMEEDGKIWFDVSVAVQCHSIIAGTIYQNIRYHLLSLLADNPEFCGVSYYRVNKSALARVLNRSLSTIKREINELLKQKLIDVNPNCSREYTICNKADLVVPDAMKNHASKSGSLLDKNGSSVEMGSGSSVEMTGSSLDKSGSFLDENGSEMDNNTHYKPFEKHIHNTHSPYAARGVRGVCSDAAGAADASKDENTCDNTRSSTVPVKENSVVALQSIKDIRISKDKLKNGFTDSDLCKYKQEGMGISESFILEKMSFEEFMIGLNAKSEAEIIKAVTPGIRKLTWDYGQEYGIPQMAWELIFLQVLEYVAEVFRLQHSESKAIFPQFKGDLDWIRQIDTALTSLEYWKMAPSKAKVDTLLAEIRRCNKNGWPTYSNGEVKFTVSPSKTAGEAARAFFEANPDLSAQDVWSVLADCVEVFKLNDKPEAGKFDPLFYSRRGIKPKFLFDHWDDIKAELDAADKLAT